MDRKRLLIWLLRLAGTIEILAFIAVVMPRSWMEVAHAWLGLGEMPHASILMFMIRQASYSYGMHGISLWLLTSDVDRFRLLILFNGIAYLLAAPVFFLIDYTAGVPFWWTLSDTASCLFFGTGVLWLTPRKR
jgi:hypothetical protein